MKTQLALAGSWQASYLDLALSRSITEGDAPIEIQALFLGREPVERGKSMLRI